MFEIDENLRPFTFDSFVNGGLHSIRPGQRCDRLAIEFQQAGIDTSELTGQTLMGLGISCHRLDKATLWHEPITDQNGHRKYPIFGRADGTEQSDYICLALLDNLPPQA